MSNMSPSDRVVWDLIDADARRVRLRLAFPKMPIDLAESIIAECTSADRERGHRAFAQAIRLMQEQQREDHQAIDVGRGRAA